MLAESLLLTILLLNVIPSCIIGVHALNEYRFLLRTQLRNQTEPPKVLFRRLNSTGDAYLFVSYLNKISQLDPYSLSLLNERVIGPKNFSIFCFAPSGNCPYVDRPLPHGYLPDYCGPRLTDVYVKSWSTSNFAYVEPTSSEPTLENTNPWRESYRANNDFTPVENALYVCYNVFHGFCERLQLTNISIARPWKRSFSATGFYHRRTSDIPIPVVNWDSSLSSTLTVDNTYIYVGLEQDQFQDTTLVHLDPLSVRLRDFDYASKEPSIKSSLALRKNSFRIKYKFSFQYTLEQDQRPSASFHVRHVYFVAQQPNITEPGMLETRIARVCSGDTLFHSYADLELSCEGCLTYGRGHSIKKFGALHMARRGTVGTAAAMLRFSRLNSSKEVPKWRQPLPFSEDFNNVLLVAFAAQLAGLRDYASAWNANFEEENPLIRGTAIAFYTLAEIDVWFGLVIQNCLDGKTSTGPSHLLPDYPKKCRKDDLLLPQLRLNQYCPTSPMNWPISGSIRSERLSAPPLLILDVDATGIAITNVANQFTILVVVTDEGQLAKYAVENDGKARLIISKQLTPRQRPLRGLTLDDAGLVAFAISDEKVYRVELQNCSSVDSCGACLALRDPYCGWCLPKGICTYVDACGTFWLSYQKSASKCPEITLIDPPGMDVNRPRSFSTHMKTLTLQLSPILAESLAPPPLSAPLSQPRLLCVFRHRHFADGGTELRSLRLRGQLYAQTEATIISGARHVKCNLPDPTELPDLDQSEKFKQTLVWLELAGSLTASEGPTYPLAAGVFIVYDCRRFSDCQTCLDNQFDCVWHLTEGRCHSPMVFQSSIGTSPASPSLGHPESAFICHKSNCKCPVFTVDRVITTVETRKPVLVVVHVPNTLIVAERFSCSENCTNRSTAGIYNSADSTVACNFPGISIDEVVNTGENASASEDTMSWHPNLLNLMSRGVIMCEIRVHWHNDHLRNQPALGHLLANPESASIEVFECSRMASHCDSCLALPQRFECVWCPFDTTTASINGARCVLAKLCPAHTNSACPNPQLLQIIPKNGTLSGETPLTIRGVNFGSMLENLEVTAVFSESPMQFIPCTILPEGFQPSRQITCRLQATKPDFTSPDTPVRCDIVLRLGVTQPQITSLSFTFLSPKVEHFSPQRGPVAGGTLLKIYGKDLNVGAIVAVALVLDGDGGQNSLNCEIIYLSANLITCRTQAADYTLLPSVSELESGVADGIPSSVILSHDKTVTRADFQRFVYKPNPTIRTVSQTVLFLSGGTTVRVYGRYFDVIQNPRIVFYHEGMEFVEPCHFSLGHLSCLSPSLNFVKRRKRDFNIHHTTTVHSIKNPFVIQKLDSFAHGEENPANFSKIANAIQIPYGFIMDNVTDLLVFDTFSVFPNPEVFPFIEGRLVESITLPSSPSMHNGAPYASTAEVGAEPALNLSSDQLTSLRDRHMLRFYGNFEVLANVPDLQALDELSIDVVTETAENLANRTCKPTFVNTDEIRCELNRKGLVEGKDYPVLIRFGKYLTARPGVVQFKRLEPLGGFDRTFIVASSLIGVITLVACLFLAMWCRSRRTERHSEKRFQTRWAEQEKCVARAFKNELQTHVDELVQDLNKTSLPIRDYQTYCLFSLFPEYHLSLVQPVDPHDMPPRTITSSLDNIEDVAATFRPHPLISSFEVPASVQEAADRGIFLFNRLLHNHHFLCLLVHTVESNRNIDARAKSQIASLLSIILQPDMEYFTQVILSLITDLLRKSRDHGGDSRLLTAFRRAESVVAKMLSNWLTFLLYNFIREHAAEHLFILYRALRQQINTGPRDAVTGLARYTLDASTLLKSDLLSRPITLLVVDPEGLFGPLCPAELGVHVLSCDTVTQAKEKILDAIYRNSPYTTQLRPTDVHLRRIIKEFDSEAETSLGEVTNLLMTDWDLDVRRDAGNISVGGPPYRLNCLSDYKMKDNDVVALVLVKTPPASDGSRTLPVVAALESQDCRPSCGSLPLPSNQTPQLSNALRQTTFNIRPTGGPNALLWYHLERPATPDSQVAEKSGRVRDDMLRRKPRHKRSLCCGPCSREMSSLFPMSMPAQQQQQQQFSGLDASSLRRWLAAEVGEAGTAGRKCTSRRIIRRPRRRSFRKARPPNCAINNNATYETVELGNSWSDDPDHAIDRPMAKLPCEIFLNRLLRTRVSVANYMERVVELIFGVTIDSQSPPLCIKFLFDFLDSQAETLGIHDCGILHAWKANCLHLRFWNQILINLDYVFDIPLLRNTALERSFHPFSQAITYACSPVLDKVTMDSPINKALFSSDIERHWLRVKRYFAEIKAMPAISERDMNVSLYQHSKTHKTEFNVSWALYELYTRHVTLCYNSLLMELRSAQETDASLSKASDNLVGDTKSCPKSHNASSLRGGLPNQRNDGWDPLCLVQMLQEVNSCMMTVACSNSSSNGESSTSKLSPSSPQTKMPYSHHHNLHRHHQQSSNGGGSSPLYPAVSHSERKLPPLPTLP